MAAELYHFIGGERVKGVSKRLGDVFNPATGRLAARVPLADAEEVLGAIEAARGAFPAWAATPPQRRARVMFRFKDLIERNADELAALVSAEHGKVVADARG